MAITEEATHFYELHFRRLPTVSNSAEIQMPLSTSGSSIVDRTGRRVKLACVNWSGAHLSRQCVSGLEYRKLSELCREIKAMGFNSVRLTFSLQMFYENPVIPNKFLTANPELFGRRAMEIFDLAVQEMTGVGLMIILNNHTSSSMWCCSDDDC